MYYIPENIIKNNHKTKVCLIGCGGTGSNLLPEISALSLNLIELGQLGLDISVYDFDIVEQSNIGRQKFYQSDLGRNKAEVLASRINRSYGDNIKAYDKKILVTDISDFDIIITAVDNVSTRKLIHKTFYETFTNQAFKIWIDIGNGKFSGQIITAINGNENTPTCVDLFPDMKDTESEPSCSTRQSLRKQNFTINKFMAIFTAQILSDIFINRQLDYSQLYVNFKSMKIKTK